MCKGIPLLGVDGKVLCCSKNEIEILIKIFWLWQTFYIFVGLLNVQLFGVFLFRLTVSRSYCLFFLFSECQYLKERFFLGFDLKQNSEMIKMIAIS